MHYANGREAKNGDRVVHIPPGTWMPSMTGILTDAIPGNDSCNGSLSIPQATMQRGCVNLAECLHEDDVKAALGTISAVQDTSKSQTIVRDTAAAAPETSAGTVPPLGASV